jgi:hypothetical protein
VSDFWVVVDKIGLPLALLLFGLLALYFDVVVSGMRYRQMRRERDRLFNLLAGNASVTARSVTVADRSTSMAERLASVLATQPSGWDADA